MTEQTAAAPHAGASSAAAPAGIPGLDRARVRGLLAGAVENLLATWDADRALLPFSSRLRGRAIVNDYAHPIAVRYTINGLLGLVEAARSPAVALADGDVRPLVDAFRARAPGRIVLPADHGLHVLLLSTLDAPRPVLRDAVTELGRLVDTTSSGALDMQSVAWILWGAAAAHRAGAPGADRVVARAYARMTGELVDGATGLPRHSARRYRRNVVSFGSLVYFLRATREAARVLDDVDAWDRFDAGVAAAISLQGAMGEWPWMIDCRSGRSFDVYPVFAVHQDSMAMLFLLPALDRGLPRAGEAVRTSLAWALGDNELRRPMYVDDPFFAFRSIERRERAPRARRYARSLAHRASAASATTGARRIRLNDECRSYHLGWLLYAWAARPELASALPGGAP